MSHTLLAQVLRQLPTPRAGRRTNVLVGADTLDDAGVYRLRPDCALVQTVDFFTPIVDDPFAFGRVAAANAMSDVYAMGGRPLTAMNLLGVPTEQVGPDVIARILRGGASMAKEAGCAIVGGHSIRNPEPIYGMSVTGIVHPKRMLTNAAARPGDLLVLTKPLGTGIATTAIKRGLASRTLSARVVKVMVQLNVAGAHLAERGLVRAATDVTGFGLLGHLANIVKASRVTAEITAASVPVLSREIERLIAQDCVPGGTRSNLSAADAIVEWGATEPSIRILLCDAQTSGGLLLCVPSANLGRVMSVLKRHRTAASAMIGRISRGQPAIRVR